MKTAIEIVRERRLNISPFVESQIIEAMDEYVTQYKNQSQPIKKEQGFKVTSIDNKLWYGTFRRKEEAVKHMKQYYPTHDYKIN